MRILVTGSTQGIGKAIAAAFVKGGHEVIVHCSKDIEKAEKIKKRAGRFCRGNGGFVGHDSDKRTL